MKIESLPNCTGCTACFASCEKGAITMTENSEGFLFPKIDSSKCISCGKCDSVCPVINQSDYLSELPLAFAVINRDDKIRETSSSGGVFWALAQYVLDKGGVVFGVKFDKSWKVVHDYAENEKDAEAFRVSKYVQSDMGDSFRKCKEFLESGRTVLFSGASCQINGLKAFLDKDYPNLICADFICAGVPSPKLWSKYTDYLEQKKASKIKSVLFRSKRNGWKRSCSDSSLVFDFENGRKLVYDRGENPYMHIFGCHTAHRTSCYSCPARGFKKASDVTFADYWGVQRVHPEWDDDCGISRLWLNTEKALGGGGYSAIRGYVEGKMELHAIDTNDPVVQGGYFTYPGKPEGRNRFFNDLEEKPFSYILKKYGKSPLWRRCYLFVRRNIAKLVPEPLKEPIKKVLRPIKRAVKNIIRGKKA